MPDNPDIRLHRNPIEQGFQPPDKGWTLREERLNVTLRPTSDFPGSDGRLVDKTDLLVALVRRLTRYEAMFYENEGVSHNHRLGSR